MNKKLSKLQTVKSERFVVTIFFDDDGRLNLQVGSEDGSGISEVEIETGEPVLKMRVSSRHLEQEIEAT